MKLYRIVYKATTQHRVATAFMDSEFSHNTIEDVEVRVLVNRDRYKQGTEALVAAWWAAEQSHDKAYKLVLIEELIAPTRVITL